MQQQRLQRTTTKRPTYNHSNDSTYQTMSDDCDEVKEYSCVDDDDDDDDDYYDDAQA